MLTASAIAPVAKYHERAPYKFTKTSQKLFRHVLYFRLPYVVSGGKTEDGKTLG